MNKARRLLAGDIGGTKTFLTLFVEEGAALRSVREATFVNADFAGPEAIIGGFLEKGDGVIAASFGIACPIEGDRCALTNLPWVIDGQELAEKFRIKRLTLINDLYAMAWGVGLLKDEDIFPLQAGAPKKGNAALLAAGTGLGEAMLIWDGKGFTPSPSEGGHTDFAPRNRLEMELFEYLAVLYGHVSYERILSGPGIADLYRFFRLRNGPEPERLKEKFKKEDAAAVVTDEALKNGDTACKEALQLFISIYGAEAGNMALKSLALGGVYIGGGIAPRILKAIKDGPFIESFRSKGRFGKLLSEVPVKVILNEKAGLLGAAVCAADLLPGRGQKRVTEILI